MEHIVGAVAAANQALNIVGQTSKALIKAHGTGAAIKRQRSGDDSDSDADEGKQSNGVSFGGSSSNGSNACECLHPLYPTLQWQAARLWLSKARVGRAKIDEASRKGRPVPMDAVDAVDKALKTARQHLERGLSFPFGAVGEADKHLRVLMSEQLAAVKLQQGGYSQEAAMEATAHLEEAMNHLAFDDLEVSIL